MFEGADENIAKGVTFERSFGKAMGKKRAHDFVTLGKSDEALAQVPRRQYTKLVAQYACGTTVVAHGYDSGKVDIMLFEARQERKVTSTTTDGN